jgi:hypothetical protein
MREACTTCAARLPEADRICHHCGTLRDDLSDPGPLEERALLDELHRAMAALIHAATPGGEPADTIRDRFLRNGFIPTHPELLVEEMVRCQQFFRDEVAADTLGPRSRYRACLLRLELLAVDQARWKPKVRVLRANLDAEGARARRSDLLMAASIIGVLAVLVGLVVYVTKAVVSLWAP